MTDTDPLLDPSIHQLQRNRARHFGPEWALRVEHGVVLHDIDL